VRPGLVRDGAILMSLGLGFIALGGAGIDILAACLSNAACYPHAAGMNIEEFLGLLPLGIALAVAGMTSFATGLLLDPRDSVGSSKGRDSFDST